MIIYNIQFKEFIYFEYYEYDKNEKINPFYDYFYVDRYSFINNL